MERVGTNMLFKKLRGHVKIIVIVVSIAFIGGMLYMGGSSFLTDDGGQTAQAAIATVNGTSISYFDFQQVYVSQLQQAQSESGRLDGRMMEIIKYRTFDSMVGNILIEQEISNRNIRVASADVNAALAELKEQFPDDEVYRQQLTMAGMTEADLKSLLEQDLRIEKLIETVVGPVDLDEDLVKEAYEEVRASHILIRANDTEEDWADAQEYAEYVLTQLEELEFSQAAEEYSDDLGSAAEGGDIGFVSRGETVPEFEQAIFNMSVGEVSGLVRTPFGYHIIKVTESRLAEGEEFEAAKPEITAKLQAAEKEKMLSSWFEQLRNSANVVINDHQLLAIDYQLDGELELAEVHYKRAIEENPEDGYLYASVGDIYVELENIEQAVLYYGEAVEKITNDGRLFFTLAQLYEELDQFDEAVVAYLRASELMPNDFQLLFQVQSALTLLERDEETEIVTERIADLIKRQEELQQLQQPNQVPGLEGLEGRDDLEDLDDLLIELEAGAEE